MVILCFLIYSKGACKPTLFYRLRPPPTKNCKWKQIASTPFRCGNGYAVSGNFFYDKLRFETTKLFYFV